LARLRSSPPEARVSRGRRLGSDGASLERSVDAFVDPIGIAGGINLYRYCGNNPVLYVDPRGLVKGDLGEALWNLYKQRAFLGATVVFQLWTQPSQWIWREAKDDGAIESASKMARKAFLVEYAASLSLPTNDGKFHKVVIDGWKDIWDTISRKQWDIVIDPDWPGNPAGILGGNRGFEARGSYEIMLKCTPWKRDGHPHNGTQNELRTMSAEIRNVNMDWRWVDAIDAHSFREYDWRNEGFLRGVGEGFVDIFSDKLLGAGYYVHVNYHQASSPEEAITFSVSQTRQTPAQ
jgi:hypothetical protein